MQSYSPANADLWTGRKSQNKLYLHEKVDFKTFVEFTGVEESAIALIGYCCDEGVKRNLGRPGAANGPDAIRMALAKMPNHLSDKITLVDVGNIHCVETEMEAAQDQLAHAITELLQAHIFPIVLGGGHDMAYGHYNGIRRYLSAQNKTIGILNFDAHFDLRSNDNGNNSGTPFYQIAQDCKQDGIPFRYLCLGIRKDANTKLLFQTAEDLSVHYVENERFNLHHLQTIKSEVAGFIQTVDCIYTTIDLDGFSSAYAPGVSAASPMGFTPDMVLEILKIIVDSKKLVSLDIAELNPEYDKDNQTAKLAASLLHFVMHMR